MTIAEIKELKESEDKVEFKEAKNQYSYNSGRRSVLGYIVALANEGGGYLVLGIREAKPHEVVGSSAWEGKEGKLEQDIYRDKQIRVSTEVIFESNKRVLVIKVPSRPIGIPLYFEDVPLMRVGDRLERMTEAMYRSIIMEQEPDFSAKVCEKLTLTDLDKAAIAKMKDSYALKQNNSLFRSLSNSQILTDLELLKNNKLNYAALILLGKKEVIHARLPQAKTIYEFRNTEAQIHSDLREIIGDPLFIGIDKIWELINNRNTKHPIQSGAYIFDIFAFNKEVIREAVLNAIAHREYSITSEVLIKQYPNKIIINNPGGFPKGVTIDNIISVSSTPRSRLMTEVLEKTGLVERSGQGVDKIYAITLSEGKPEPSYKDSDLFQVSLKLSGIVEDKAFHVFISAIQRSRSDENKLDAVEIDALYKVKTGQETQVKPDVISKLEKENLIHKTVGSHYALNEDYKNLSTTQLTNISREEMWLRTNEKRLKTYLIKNGRINNKEFQKLFNVEERAASRELGMLVEMKVLIKVGTTGRGTMYIWNDKSFPVNSSIENSETLQQIKADKSRQKQTKTSKSEQKQTKADKSGQKRTEEDKSRQKQTKADKNGQKRSAAE